MQGWAIVRKLIWLHVHTLSLTSIRFFLRVPTLIWLFFSPGQNFRTSELIIFVGIILLLEWSPPIWRFWACFKMVRLFCVVKKRCFWWNVNIFHRKSFFSYTNIYFFGDIAIIFQERSIRCAERVLLFLILFFLFLVFHPLKNKDSFIIGICVCIILHVAWLIC